MKVKCINNAQSERCRLTNGKLYELVRVYEFMGTWYCEVLADDNNRRVEGILRNRFEVINGEKQMRNNNVLPNDVESVIFNWNNTVVTLTDGRKGVSKCEECDEFDPYTGYTIAYYKAKHDKNFELKRMFNGCIEYSKKKGYKQTIIKSK
jgi:hypothetical protein